MLISGVEFPWYLRQGIKPNERGAVMYKCIYGADTETYKGKPHTLQFYSEDIDTDEIIFTDEYSALDATLEWCQQRRKAITHVVYCHNLKFDLPEFLYNKKMHREMAKPGGAFDFTYKHWHIKGCYGAPTFCTIRDTKTKNRTIHFVDSFCWFQTSLEKTAEIVCPDLPKLKAPKNLGNKIFSMRDDVFVEYAMRDAEVAYYAGKVIEQIHKEFDIAQGVSLADMSSKIFRHHFLDYTIPQPKYDVNMSALRSYHGGKNNMLPDAAPRWHTNVNLVDISSAYPFAMSQLPAFNNKRAYKRIKFSKMPRTVPEFGIYCCSGEAKACDYPVAFDHSFNPLVGKFSRIWIQGYELNEALRTKEIKLSKCYGHYYDVDKDSGRPALVKFVKEFYKRKQNETDPTLRYMYKIILNALYGKFIQTRKTMRVEYFDVDAIELGNYKQSEILELRAGGMFHPFIATAITAHTRAYIHRLEHEYKAIHTATDGIFTKQRRIKRIGKFPSSGLGAVEIEASGDLCLLRNKCYILYSKNGKISSQYFRSKRIEKYAKHGFQGTVYDLEKLIAHNKRKYTVTRPNQLRESLKRNLQVNEFIERDMVLRVAPVKA